MLFIIQDIPPKIILYFFWFTEIDFRFPFTLLLRFGAACSSSCSLAASMIFCISSLSSSIFPSFAFSIFSDNNRSALSCLVSDCSAFSRAFSRVFSIGFSAFSCASLRSFSFSSSFLIEMEKLEKLPFSSTYPSPPTLNYLSKIYFLNSLFLL